MSENEPKRILAIGAHPDDVEFGCGAILLKAAENGARIQILLCSQGESGSNGTAEERARECEAAANRLRAELHFLECGGDARIESSKRNELALARVLRELRPEIVLAPSLVEDQHPDHSAVGRMARNASRLARYAGIEELKGAPAHAIESLFYYAITPGAEPLQGTPLLVEVGSVKDEWVRLMECHASQMKTRRYVELQLARARALGLQVGGEYAQALWSNDPLRVSCLSAAPEGARLF